MTGKKGIGILRPSIVARHYRGIIVTLVMVNTALIVFLIVYIWSFAPDSHDSLPGEVPIAVGEVNTQRLILWSEPGGLEHGAESRGVVEKGSTVRILRGQRFEQDLWLNVIAGERTGWLLENDIDYVGSPDSR
jgi:hypothetical protein